MNIYISKYEENRIGGGWTFLHNFRKGIGNAGGRIISVLDDADIFFIPSVTQLEKSEVYEADKKNIPIVLRVDNIPRASRNRRQNPAERLKEFGKLAQVVVYQSAWAMVYAGYLAGDGTVINNGCDTSIFYQGKGDLPRDKKTVDLIVAHNNDENKRISEALYRFHMDWRNDPDRELWLVGRYHPDLVNNKFDLFAGEDFKYFGVVDKPDEMAEIMRSADNLIYPAVLDACPNVVVEARACGMNITHTNEPGGVRETLTIQDLSIDRMCEEYMAVFKLCKQGIQQV